MRDTRISDNESPLSQAEIDALLKGVTMGYGRNLAVTAYGHDNVIDKIAISSFENSDGYGHDNNALTYCKMLNGLELNGNSWVFARVVPENTPLDLSFFLPVSFSNLILGLDDMAIQKVYREIDNQELAKALKGCSEAVMEKSLRNISKRASQMLKEDMEYMGPIREKDIKECQDKIIAVIKHLEETGEIVVARTGREITVK